MTTIIAYIATLAVLTVVDFVWRRFVMMPVFQADVPDLLAAKPNTLAAANLYAAFSAGLVHFAVVDAVARKSVVEVARDGALTACWRMRPTNSPKWRPCATGRGGWWSAT